MTHRTPIFSAEGGDPSRSRILLISWHFPPGQAAGALRWQRLSEHAYRRGWELDVLTVQPDRPLGSDEVTFASLPPGTRVYGVAAREPAEARLEAAGRGLTSWLRRIGSRDRSRGRPGDRLPEDPKRPHSLHREEVRLLPWSPADLRRAFFSWLAYRRGMEWANSAVSIGREVLEREPNTRIVVSSGPPHTAHDAARRLGQAASLPFVMDLRDPWSQVQRLPEHLASPVGYRLAARHERRCVAAAALIVANTDPARDALISRYPEASDRVITVMNGYDDEPLPESTDHGPFVIAHAGTVYLDRDPRLLFRALARITRAAELSPDRLVVRFFGCTDERIRRMAESEGIGAHVELNPFLPRDELRRRLVECPVLVVLPQDSDLAIPSKVFEYLRYPAWVLAMADEGSATECVLRETTAAVIGTADVDGLQARLDDWRCRFERGERPSPIAPTVPELSRRAQADRLFQRVEAIVTS